MAEDINFFKSPNPLGPDQNSQHENLLELNVRVNFCAPTPPVILVTETKVKFMLTFFPFSPLRETPPRFRERFFLAIGTGRKQKIYSYYPRFITVESAHYTLVYTTIHNYTCVTCAQLCIVMYSCA